MRLPFEPFLSRCLLFPLPVRSHIEVMPIRGLDFMLFGAQRAHESPTDVQIGENANRGFPAEALLNKALQHIARLEPSAILRREAEHLVTASHPASSIGYAVAA